MKNFSLLLLSIWLLVSCSHYASHGEHIYLESRNGPSLTVPSPFTQANISHFYDLPTSSSSKNLKISLAPPPTENKAQAMS